MIIKAIGMTCITLGLICTIFLGINGCYANYKWNRDIESWWELADKSSTIEAKSEYIQKFVEALDSQKLTGYNAIIFKTPNNNIEKNIEAVKTLNKRLQDIKGMKPDSFEYNQAIQQITAQEQGEATKLIKILFGGWLLHSGYWYLWDWILAIIIFFLLLLFTIGGILLSGVFD